MLPLLLLALATAPLEPFDCPWGPDADLVKSEQASQTPPRYSLASRACQRMIRLFQVYVSPIDGPRSSFYPSSSQYTLEAIQKYGVLEGIARGCDRLLRENDENWVYEIGDELKLDPVR